MGDRRETREARRCGICGRRLIGDYYYYGRCREHQTTKDADAKVDALAVEAKRRGMSYGQYVAAIKEAEQNDATGKRH